MDQETFTRAIITNLIDRYIPEIRSDTGRSVRKLVDMVERISDGHFQKIFFQMMQTMAKNQNSPYYPMIRNWVTETDPRYFKSFALNLAYNSWTCGARNIRLLEMESGLFIPWVLSFLRDAGEGRIPFSESERLFAEAREREIYSFLFVYRGEMDEWEPLLSLIQAQKDCAFCLLLDPCALSEDVLDRLLSYPNLFVTLNGREQGWERIAGMMKARRMPFSVYYPYDSEADAAEIIENGWVESLLPFGPLSAATLPLKSCSREVADRVSQFMFDTRLGQRHPIMPIDLCNDCLIIGDIISYRRMMFAVDTDGSILRAKDFTFEDTGLSVRGMSFEEILRRIS